MNKNENDNNTYRYDHEEIIQNEPNVDIVYESEYIESQEYDEINGSINQDNGSYETGKTGIKNKKKKSKFKGFMKFVSKAAVFGVIAALTFHGTGYFIDENNKDKLQEDAIESDGVGTVKEKPNAIETSNNDIIAYDVSEVVDTALPSIVAINSKSHNQEYDLFGRAYTEPMEGSGSGVIIGQNEDELLIVTNNHVIDSADEVEIVFADDSTAQAKVKGAESRSDLAVLSVDLKDLSKETLKVIKVASIGNSDELKLGELAIAIGNALGYGQSVTVGYISAVEREVTVEGLKLTLVQTDAAINPGNSGGALLNSKGELIGINTVKYASSKVEGMGFAIPISDAVPVINELMERETIDENDSGFLGINTALAKDVTKEDSERFSMPIGIYINGVMEGSPAEKSGLKQGDIIVGIDKKEVMTIEDLVYILKYTKGGEEITLVINVLEDGQYIEKKLTVTLGRRGDLEQ